MNQGKKETESKSSSIKSKLIAVLSWIWPYVIAIILALILKSTVFILANIPSTSMLNTLQVDDKVYGYRLAYNEDKRPERGDIIIFNSHVEKDELYIKRLIGLPGEKVEIRDAKIYINDSTTPIREDYLPNKWVVLNDGITFYVPEGEYLFMGDNRNASNDARKWKYPYVKEEDIVAKAIFVYWPISSWKVLNKDD